MPIFQDDISRGPATPDRNTDFNPAFVFPPRNDDVTGRRSEESIRTELCEGPVDTAPPSPEDAPSDLHSQTSDRVELIERLKRGESPTWIPNRRLFNNWESRPPSRKSNSDKTLSSPLLPSAEITESSRPTSSHESNTLRAGLEIERPRSALHSGDFTQDSHARPSKPLESESREEEQREEPERSPPQSWLSTTPPRGFIPFRGHDCIPSAPVPVPDFRLRSRAPSLSSSYSSSFLFKPPTSPLVQSLNNDDLELGSPLNSLEISSGGRNDNRHSFLSSSLQSSPQSTSPLSHGLPFQRPTSSPYQAHQPRRSSTNTQFFSQTSSPGVPSTPFLRSRRPSCASESSPLHHASMVGSYEESILRGRMSTTPSKPLDFVAQIGVLGRGKCKPNLRCPAHVTIPFPAVFYSYNSTGHGRSDGTDGPSPYVGQIDLENGLPSYENKHEPRSRRRTASRKPTEDIQMTDGVNEHTHRQVQKQKRRSTSPKAPPGGSYRIPEKGQLQIIIKNPNKTAVKLFLIPYDLEGMEPGTKTFIRQRIYSAGPIIELPVANNAQPSAPDASHERPTLRYLVHVHICSPSKGRFFLYKSIRVVFANRVPDGKEHLYNEIQLPEPRFSVYKPARELPGGPTQGSMAGAMLSAEKAFRRRSAGVHYGSSQRAFDATDTMGQYIDMMDTQALHPGHSNRPVNPIPLSLRHPTFDLTMIDNDKYHPRSISPTSTLSSRPQTSQTSQSSPNGAHRDGSWLTESAYSAPFQTYDKLSKGEPGYGGNPYAFACANQHHNGQSTATEGLLARRLRGLDVGYPNCDAEAGKESL